jgi:tetratricopeptide (TPR) repeat protein
MAIQESFKLCRQLAADQPAAYNLDLACSLNNLSNCLSDLGHLEDALITIQEAVKLCRQLAAERHTVFNSLLAHSLSNHQSHLGNQEDALKQF